MGDSGNGIPEVCSRLVTSVPGYSKKPFDEKSGWRDSSWFEQPRDLILKTLLPYFINCFFLFKLWQTVSYKVVPGGMLSGGVSVVQIQDSVMGKQA